MKRWILWLAGGAALGLFVFELSTWSDRAAAARDPMTDELRALRKEVESLKRKSDTSRVHYVLSGATPSEALPPAANAHGPRQEPEQPALPAEPAEPEQQARERNREVATSLDVRFASERIDAEWSTTTVRQIREVIAASAAGSRLVEADCASSLCRVVVSHETEEDRRDLGMEIAELDPFRTGVFYDYDEESQPLMTTLFVLRPGHSFAEDQQNF